MQTEALLHHIASFTGILVSLMSESLASEHVLPSTQVLVEGVDSTSPPDPFLTYSGNLGLSEEDQEGEDGEHW